jgi:hypothetical protein
LETALFNKSGKPVAYIGEESDTIYLWDGRPVAFLFQGKVYGWNGLHLGWFANGTLFDIYGFRCGFIRSKAPIPTQMEPMKPARGAKPAKSARQTPVAKPTLHYGFSGKSLEDLLEKGAAI